MSLIRRLVVICIIALVIHPASAQDGGQPADSLVRLMNASSLQLLRDDFHNYRLVVDARFLHNDAYLVCDTAYWYVADSLINAYGHVQIIQNETVLSSDQLDYLVNKNLAQFRGSLVQLQDKDNNTLRTRYLDYNTKDSVAVFSRGASMRDKNGQIIESDEGTYDSKSRTFTFESNVNMYTDSVFVATDLLNYFSENDVADFHDGVYAWKDDNMLSSWNATYDRRNEVFTFSENVHVMSKDQEGWADTLYFYRDLNNVIMLGDAQVTDDSRGVGAMAGYIFYEDSLSRVTMLRAPAVYARTDQQDKVDTLYFAADSIEYFTIRRCDIEDSVLKDSEARVKELDVDPVTEFRQKAAEEAAKKAEEESRQSLEQMGLIRPNSEKKAEPEEGQDPEEQADPEGQADSEEQADPEGQADPEEQQTLEELTALEEPLEQAMQRDSVLVDSVDISLDADKLLADSTLAGADSVDVALDTTKMGFLTAVGSVRVFRQDIQMRCDSLLYTDLDSLVRMYVSPVIWNDGNRQYTSDSVTVIIKNGKLDRASLMSNAFIVIQEDTTLFDQIRGSEVMAYFDTTSALRRFDALGGADALFYLKENDAFATVNRVSSKMISAYLSDGDLDKIFYFQEPKNDAYPLVQLPKEESRMKGFTWQPDEKPKDRFDIVEHEPKLPERSKYERYEEPSFPYTRNYFPGYMDEVYRELAIRDSLRRAAAQNSASDSLETEESTLDGELMDVGVDPDERLSPEEEVVPVPEEEFEPVPEEGPETAGQPVPDERELKKQAREQKRQQKIDAKNEKWAILDARDAAKAAAKEQKALEKKREITRKALIAAEKQAAKDQKRLDRYIKRYERRLSRRNKGK